MGGFYFHFLGNMEIDIFDDLIIRINREVPVPNLGVVVM